MRTVIAHESGVVGKLHIDCNTSTMDVVVRLRVTHGGVRVQFRTPKHLVFDTETDGRDRCIELAYIVLDDRHEECFRYCRYWKLPGAQDRIAPHAYRVHKISADTLASHGVPAPDELRAFFEWTDRVKRAGGSIVAHNAAFDARVLATTAAAWGVPCRLAATDCLCTMVASKARAGCVDVRGRPKAPKNAELYAVLFDAPPTWANLHSALDDVRVTARNFEEGGKRGWWMI